MRVLLMIFPIILFLLSTSAFADLSQIQNSLFKSQLKEECQNNKKYLSNSYKSECYLSYHHYNSDSYVKNYSRDNALKNKSIKISEFNALHPGMGKTRFKDYKKLAQIINEFDVVGVTELIPLMSADLKNNMAMINFIKSAPATLIQLNKEIKSLKASIAASRRGSVTKKRKLNLLIKKKEQILEDQVDIKSLYRAPGYVKILKELHKLRNGKVWSLILAPRGEGSIATPIPELVGYFYRSSIVRPMPNYYCKSHKKRGKESPFACIINMDKKDLGKDKSDAFARRPFMGEFISGDFSFTLITSHVLFLEPNDPAVALNILQKAFGIQNYKELGPGATKEKYARFAEVKMTLDFISRFLSKYKNHQDVIFMGDFNLEKKNPFWKKVLNSWDDSKLFIKSDTSLSANRYNIKGEQTNGRASNYDHFLFNPRETDECISPQTNNIIGGVYDFVNGKLSGYLNTIYKVRNENFITPNNLMPFIEDGYYEKNVKKYNKAIKRFVTPKLEGDSPILTIKSKYVTSGRHRLKSVGIVIDEEATQKYAQYFKERVLDSQLKNKTYYYYFAQLVSDHYPIYMSCSTK